ncbi:MAG: hypothetical protein ACOC5T_08100 [Elusimicrobiota bacterium]
MEVEERARRILENMLEKAPKYKVVEMLKDMLEKKEKLEKEDYDYFPFLKPIKMEVKVMENNFNNIISEVVEVLKYDLQTGESIYEYLDRFTTDDLLMIIDNLYKKEFLDEFMEKDLRGTIIDISVDFFRREIRERMDEIEEMIKNYEKKDW